MPSILSTNHPDWEVQASALRGEPLADILKKLGIREYSKNILKMSKEELLQEFGRGTKRLNKSLFIKNIIWQTWQKLQAGETPFDIGNIRSFWYYIKDTMDRAGATKTGDPYNIVSDMFVLMVKAGLFHYRDWGFDDDNQGSRWIGNKNRNIILFAEKTSYTDLLQSANQIYDITTIAAGGQSSYLSIEYFVHELHKQGTDLNQEFFVFSILPCKSIRYYRQFLYVEEVPWLIAAWDALWGYLLKMSVALLLLNSTLPMPGLTVTGTSNQ